MATADMEVDRLRTRIDELEDELDRERGRRRSSRRLSVREADETLDDFRDVTERKGDEFSRLLRGLLRAAMETKHVFSDSVSEFADEVLERNVPERGDAPRDVLTRLPSDLMRSAVHGWDRALDAPRRAVDTFNGTYRDERYDRRGGRRRSSRDSRSDRRAYDRRDDRYDRRDDRSSSRRDTRPVDREELETWTKAELLEYAGELGVEGRSSMTKSELVDAIVAHEAPLEDLSRAELYRRASDLDVEGRSSMRRDELIAAIRSAEAS